MLDQYRKKQRFGRTLEPPPGVLRPEEDPPVFVIYKHTVIHHYYNFRLEVGVSLKS